ncbi:MAG: diguanylate cyclase [Anaerocolumna sp.]
MIIYGTVEEVEQITGDLLEKIRTSVELREYGITISLGITNVREDDSIDSILIRADSGLYQAKSKRKNRVIQV